MTFSLDIAHLSASYAAGSLTPRDVISEVFGRIAKSGVQPNWISLHSEQDVMAKLAVAPKGPLYGIPFAVKDNIDCAGLLTTCACPAYAYFPSRSAAVVERLEAAGALVIGKTNLDQFATGLVGTRSPYGIPSSAFNKDYISGGSSSGSAVAVAGGLVSFALGTDTAGSGRVPAAFNNIIGLKPTKGLISARGVVPACRSLDTVSIFALTTADAHKVFTLAAAYDHDDCFARIEGNRQPHRWLDARPRIGIPAAPLEFFGDTDALALYDASVERARVLGADIVPIDFAPFQQAAALLYQGPWVAERLAAIKNFTTAEASAMHETVREIVLSASGLTAVEAFEGFYRLSELIQQARAAWRTIDMLLLPTAPTTYTIAEVLADPVRLNSNLGLYTNFVNLMDLSALAVPGGFRRDGLPFGITLVGPPCADGALAQFGDRMHRAMRGIQLGATGHPLDATSVMAPSKEDQAVQIAVVGAHLAGQPLNTQLVERNARLVRTAQTARGYSFYALPDTSPAKPGLVFDGQGAGHIEVEIWEMEAANFGSFVALVPAPLAIGTLALADGTAVKGFLCEAHAVKGARDITGYGGWRAWLSNVTQSEHFTPRS